MIKGEAREGEGRKASEGERQKRTQRHSDRAEADEESAGPCAILECHEDCNVAPVHRPGRPCAISLIARRWPSESESFKYYKKQEQDMRDSNIAAEQSATVP